MGNSTPDEMADVKRRVPQLFDGVAPTYDLLQRLNPGYAKHLRMSARRLGQRPGPKLLDLCCGTGLSTVALRETYPAAEITALDASSGMLAQAQKRRELRSVEFVLGDAMEPAASGVTGPFDGIMMAYGIRNMPDADACLRNVLALLAEGGTVCFHEYSVADSLVSRLVWNLISLSVIIPLGAVTAPRSGIYRYLRRSVLDFDGVSEFERRLERAGFVDVRTEKMGGWASGIVHSFLGRKNGRCD
jgi:ubiquinone/menaquinone biosynthesis methyltransferase